MVDIEWPGQHLNDKDLLMVDFRPKNYYEYAHIQGSTHTDTALWRQPDPSGIPAMLPDKKHLQGLLSQMGATPESHIVLVGSGDSANDLANATCIYWTLEQIGHEKKSILDGGIISYANARLPLKRGASNVPPSTYSIFRIKQDQISADEIHKNANLSLLDTRSKAEYLGIYGVLPMNAPVPFQEPFPCHLTGLLLTAEDLL